MLVDEWAESVWTLISVRPKTLYDYKYLYRIHLKPVIGHMKIDEVESAELQRKLISLPPQTARHTLMVAKLCGERPPSITSRNSTLQWAFEPHLFSKRVGNFLRGRRLMPLIGVDITIKFDFYQRTGSDGRKQQR